MAGVMGAREAQCVFEGDTVPCRLHLERGIAVSMAVGPVLADSLEARIPGKVDARADAAIGDSGGMHKGKVVHGDGD